MDTDEKMIDISYIIFFNNVLIIVLIVGYYLIWMTLQQMQEIFYMDDSELQAFKRFKEISHMNKELLLADVKMVTMFNKFEVIESFEVIKKIA